MIHDACAQGRARDFFSCMSVALVADLVESSLLYMLHYSLLMIARALALHLIVHVPLNWIPPQIRQRLVHQW